MDNTFTSQEAERLEVSDDIVFLAKSPSACYLGIGYIVRVLFLSYLNYFKDYFISLSKNNHAQAYVVASKMFKVEYKRSMFITNVDEMNEALFSRRINVTFLSYVILVISVKRRLGMFKTLATKNPVSASDPRQARCFFPPCSGEFCGMWCFGTWVSSSRNRR